jgi:hypothetical protein
MDDGLAPIKSAFQSRQIRDVEVDIRVDAIYADDLVFMREIRAKPTPDCPVGTSHSDAVHVPKYRQRTHPLTF